ncbi:farnesol dehydrogenase [Leptinotarsa decemlineata]|uniref:farnesol dehydrogenase n=1 Tax=Leptinotarsa decemlineata TaxID=7539 RepID=UPI000C251A57|nr:farnesol dehydrogenase-like [Leptinotarsa decemlineata]
MVASFARWFGKVAVVTGASSGIGAAITKRLVEEGMTVVGVARRKERIENIAKTLRNKNAQLFGFQVDITKEEELINAFKWTTDNVGPVHVLVNSAGINLAHSLEEGNLQIWKKILETNVLAVCISTREAIKIMKEHDIDGHIINVNSVLGHKVVSPASPLYTASKFSITSLTESLRLEQNLRNSKIKITSISPGAVDTPILSEEFRTTKYFMEILQKSLLNPEDIADATVYVLSTPPHVQVHELTVKGVNEPF